MKIYKNGLYLANPAHIFLLVWVTTLFLVSLGLTSNLEPLNAKTLLLVVGNILSFYFSVAIFTPPKKQITTFNKTPDINIESLRLFTKKLLLVWFFGSIVDIIFSGGLPFFWSLAGNTDKNYTDFGIPSFHGVMNACFLLGLTCLFLDYLITKKKKKLFIIFILLFWPILMLGRGILLSALMQMISLFLLLNRVSIKAVFVCLFFGFVLIVLFGITGDARGNGNPFVYLITSDSRTLFNNLPSGFLWVYIYITAGLNNINANINSIVPQYFPWYSISNLVPSSVRWLVSSDKRHDTLQFVDENLNTSTFYAGYLSDFGALGAFVVVFLLQLIWVRFYVSARKQSVSAMLSYAIIVQCVIFSIFYDLFLLLPYLFQIFLAQMYRKKIKWS